MVRDTKLLKRLLRQGTGLMVDIVNEDLSIKHIVYDGQYQLGVNSLDFHFDKRGAKKEESKEINISTNYENGWKAYSNVSWIKFIDGDSEVETQEGDMGTDGVLKFTVMENGSNARDGVITIQSGRLKHHIDISQARTNAFEVTEGKIKGNLFPLYPMNGKEYEFELTTVYEWRARVLDDEYNVLAKYTNQGHPNVGDGGKFKFTMLDEFLDKVLPDDKLEQTVTVEFYSPTDEFEPVRYKINAWGGTVIADPKISESHYYSVRYYSRITSPRAAYNSKVILSPYKYGGNVEAEKEDGVMDGNCRSWWKGSSIAALTYKSSELKTSSLSIATYINTALVDLYALDNTWYNNRRFDGTVTSRSNYSGFVMYEISETGTSSNNDYIYNCYGGSFSNRTSLQYPYRLSAVGNNNYDVGQWCFKRYKYGDK